MSKSTPRRAGKALPPIYVVVSDDEGVIHMSLGFDKKEARSYVEYPGDRIVKYLPAPARRAKGGGRGK